MERQPFLWLEISEQKKKSPVRSLSLCNPKARVSNRDEKLLVSYNKISVQNSIQSDGRIAIRLARDQRAKKSRVQSLN